MGIGVGEGVLVGACEEEGVGDTREDEDGFGEVPRVEVTDGIGEEVDITVTVIGIVTDILDVRLTIFPDPE